LRKDNTVTTAAAAGEIAAVPPKEVPPKTPLLLQLNPPHPHPHPQKYCKALVVLPYISIVGEKTEHLTALLRPMGASVKGFFGGDEDGRPLASRGEDVAVCTIEKANSAINRLAQEGRLGELCCVVVDELHMISNENRGVVLELALTKLLAAECRAQVVGMSATSEPLPITQDSLVFGPPFELRSSPFPSSFFLSFFTFCPLILQWVVWSL
jgi:hypothetical protein